jgi:hypothetical protein
MKSDSTIILAVQQDAVVGSSFYIHFTPQYLINDVSSLMTGGNFGTTEEYMPVVQTLFSLMTVYKRG